MLIRNVVSIAFLNYFQKVREKVKSNGRQVAMRKILEEEHNQ